MSLSNNNKHFSPIMANLFTNKKLYRNEKLLGNIAFQI